MGLRLPRVRQTTDYSCGAAALTSVLRGFGRYQGPEQRLHRTLGTNTVTGTHPTKIVKLARRMGLGAELREGLTVTDLRRAVRGGKAVILDLQAWRDPPQHATPYSKTWDSGHYVVVKAVGTKYLHVMDPWVGPGYTYLPISELKGRWHDKTQEPGRGAVGPHSRLWFQSGIVIDPPRSQAGAPAARAPVPGATSSARGLGLIRME